MILSSKILGGFQGVSDDTELLNSGRFSGSIRWYWALRFYEVFREYHLTLSPKILVGFYGVSDDTEP